LSETPRRGRVGQLRKPVMPVAYAVLILLVITVGLAGIGIAYTGRVAENTKQDILRSEREHDRQLCGVIDASLRIQPNKPIPQPPVTPPNATQDVKDRDRAIRAMLKLRTDLKCPKPVL
jgi:hypothetical protein